MNTEHPSAYRKHARPNRILLYDTQVGGIGLTKAMLSRGKELLEAALDIVETCRCKTGCPSCVHDHLCKVWENTVKSCLLTSFQEYNEVIDKPASVIILKSLISSWGKTRHHAALPETPVKIPLDGRIIISDSP